MFAVIMAGGKGARFWPRSREKMPKHLLDILGERTIIRETVDRIRPLVPAERTLIVTGRSHAAELIRQLPEIPPENILIEPVGRNTAPCIGLAALHILKRVPDEVMLVLPSDHRIGDEAAFREVLQAAADAALQGDPLVTIGIRPTGPETGYGYIEQGERYSDNTALDADLPGPLHPGKTAPGTGGALPGAGRILLEQRDVRLEGLDDHQSDRVAPSRSPARAF